MIRPTRPGGLIPPLFFLAGFILTQLFFLVDKSIAMDNSTLNGTYAYAQPMSAFKDADVNGGFGATDSERMLHGEFTFDGAGGCTDSFTKEVVDRTIGETASKSNTFTTAYSSTFNPPAACTYSLSGDGTLRMTFDPGGPGEETRTGMVTLDGGTIIFGLVHVEPGVGYYSAVIIAIKKGAGMSNASLSGTYGVAYKGASFWGADANGGFGRTEGIDLNDAEVTFDGAGNCSGTITEHSIERSINETASFSNTFNTTYNSATVPLPTCVYTVAGDGTMTMTTDPGGLAEDTETGTVSADGRTIIIPEAYNLPGDYYGTGLIMAVKRPAAFTNASIKGAYSWVTIASAFTGSDTHGGFGMTDREHIERGDIALDGAGGCTFTDFPEERIHRTIDETMAFSNTFTTVHIPNIISAKPCAYDVAPDGTMTLTLNPGGPNEITRTASIREDGNFSLSTFISNNPDWNGVSLSMVVKKSPHTIKNDLLIDFSPSAGLWARYNDAAWTKLHALSPTLIATGDLDATGKDEALAVFAPYGLYARYDNAGPWTRLHSLIPSIVATGNMDGGGDEVAAVFPTYGIYARYNNTGGWSRLSSIVPEQVVMADLDGNGKDDLIADFGAMGIWAKYNNGAWTKIIGADAGLMATGDLDGNGQAELMVHFPSFGGIWTKNNNAGWTKLHALAPESIVTADLNGTGRDEVIIDFGAVHGIWAKYNDASWTKLHAVSPDAMTTGDLDATGKDDLVADFGAFGVYVKYNDGAWTKIHASNPELMGAGNLDGN